MLYGTQFGSVPSSDRAADRAAVVGSRDDVHRALALRVTEKSLWYVSDMMTVLYVAPTS